MTGTVYRAADRRFTPWKNGGGETAEILCYPAGAGFHDFDWRFSTARVASSGPFSTFQGVDRILTVLEGGSMTLILPEGTKTLSAESPPFGFSGDAPCQAILHGAPLLDLNVMVRRPLQAMVIGPDTIDRLQEAGHLNVKASYLFAQRANPALGMDAYDLLTLADGVPETLPMDTIAILIVD